MEIVLLNGVRYSVEFIKLMLVVVFILNLEMKKRLNHFFILSLVVILSVSFRIDLSKYSIIYGLVAFVVFFAVVRQKKEIIYIILSYVGISLIDMLLGIFCIHLFHITDKQIQDHAWIIVVMNSISFIPITIVSLFFKKKKTERNIGGSFWLVLLMGGISLSVYLTYTQYVCLAQYNPYFQDGFTVSAVVIIIGYILVCYFFLKNRIRNQYLQMENDANQKLLKAQSDYYTMRLRKETETKMFRHDISQHISCICMLFQEKRYEELGSYLKQMEMYTKDLSLQMITGNEYVDIILADLSEQFTDIDVRLEGKIPPVKMASMDICSLFYNLLKNAFEAAHRVSDKLVDIKFKTDRLNIIIYVSNSYDVVFQNKDGTFATRKLEKEHGFGLANIKKCVEKYCGFYGVNVENNTFCTEIILPDVVKTEVNDER